MDEVEKPKAPSLRFISTDDYLAFYLAFSEGKDMKKIKRSDMMVAMTNHPTLSACFSSLEGDDEGTVKAWLIGNGESRFDKIHERLVNKHNSVKAALINMGYKPDDVSAANFPLPNKGTRATADTDRAKSLFDKIRKRK